MLGRVLKDSFTIHQKIGAGGMGTVYRATQDALGRDVAIKVLSPSLGGNEDLVKRFYREGKILSGLNHPNIVNIIDFGSTGDGMLYMVMEFLKGSTLDENVPATGLSPARVVDLAGQILGGVGAAHSQGLIHRDLKPANIFLAKITGEVEVVKILDFGIAKAVGEGEQELTRAGFMMGTPGYIAPEQISDSSTSDSRCDIYALGSILYYMLTGLKPYAGKSSHAILTKQMADPPELCDFPSRGLPAGLDGLIRHAMAIEPEDRIQSTDELYNGLCAALGVASQSGTRMQRRASTRAVTPAKAGDPTRLAGSGTGQMPTIPGLSSAGIPNQGPTSMQPGVPYPTAMVPGQLPTGMAPGPFPTGMAPGQYPTGMGPYPTQYATQVPPPGHRYMPVVLALLALLVGGGFVAMFMQGRGDPKAPVASADDASKARLATLAAKDRLVGLKTKTGEQLERSKGAIATIEEQLATAIDPELKKKHGEELMAAKCQLMLHEGILQLGQQVVFGGPRWTEAENLIQLAEAQLGQQSFATARDNFDGARKILEELEVRSSRVQDLEQIKSVAMIARWQWKDLRERTGLSDRSEAAGAEVALRNGDGLASDVSFDRARAMYSDAREGFTKALEAGRKELEEARGLAAEARTQARVEQEKLDAALAGTTGLARPEAAAKADELVKAADVASQQERYATATAGYREAQASYAAALEAVTKVLKGAEAVTKEAALAVDKLAAACQALLDTEELARPAQLAEAEAARTEGGRLMGERTFDAANAKYGAARALYEAALAELALLEKANAERSTAARALSDKAFEEVKAFVGQAAEQLVADHRLIVERAAEAAKLVEGRRHKKAVEAYDGAREALRKWTGRFHNEQGDTFFNDDDFPKAIEAYGKAYKADPATLRYLNNLASAKYNNNQLDGALADLEIVLKADPKYRDAHVNMGLVRAAREEYPAAVDSFKRAVELDPTYWLSWDLLAQSYSGWKNPAKQQDMIDAYKKAYELAPPQKKKELEDIIKQLTGGR